jgi:hypothetical protein
VNNPDCKYRYNWKYERFRFLDYCNLIFINSLRLGFFINYQQKFYSASIADSKELIGDIEVVINELNCHPHVPKNALFDKATITDFILTKCMYLNQLD